MTSSSDSDLLRPLQAGEPAAQRELFRRCQERLRPYFHQKLRNPSDVEDCVSEVIARTLEGIRHGRQPRVLDAWIMGIAWHVAQERYREADRRDDRELPADLPQEPNDPALKLEHAT